MIVEQQVNELKHQCQNKENDITELKEAYKEKKRQCDAWEKVYRNLRNQMGTSNTMNGSLNNTTITSNNSSFVSGRGGSGESDSSYLNTSCESINDNTRGRTGTMMRESQDHEYNKENHQPTSSRNHENKRTFSTATNNTLYNPHSMVGYSAAPTTKTISTTTSSTAMIPMSKLRESSRHGQAQHRQEPHQLYRHPQNMNIPNHRNNYGSSTVDSQSNHFLPSGQATKFFDKMQ